MKKATIMTSLLFLFLNAQGQNQVTTVSGTGSAGLQNGDKTVALFNQPRGITADKDGNLFITDILNNVIRKCTQNGDVTTFVGTGTQSSTDGDFTTASFYGPAGICFDKNGIMYITESSVHTIRKIDTTLKTVTTIAGNGNAGSNDANGLSATFNTPTDIEVDNDGNLYIADYSNGSIRKMAPNGDVTTLATGISNPHGLCLNKTTGDIYVGGRSDGTIYKIDKNGTKSNFVGDGSFSDKDGVGLSSANIIQATDLSYNQSENAIYVVCDYGKMRRISVSDTVVTTPVGLKGIIDYSDGNADSVSLNYPTGVVSLENGQVFITELFGNKIKKYSKHTIVTGINQKISNNTFTIFPNPTSNFLNLVFEQNIPSNPILIYSAFGEEVTRISNASMQTTIDISGLAAGVYFISCSNKQGQNVLKFVKN